MNNSRFATPTLYSPSLPCSNVVSTLFTVIISIVTFAALIGNVLVIASFLKTPNLRTSTNYYIINLAISDLLCACFNWPLYAVEGMLTRAEFFNQRTALILCKMGICFRTISQVVSVLCLVLTSVDRYAAIVHPMRTTVMRNGKIRVLLLLFAWIIPFGFAYPYYTFAEVVNVNNKTFCRVLWNISAHTVFNAVGFVIFYCIPLTVIIILYTRITKTLKNRPDIENTAQEQQIRRRRREQHQKIMKILTSIVAGFFICWTPLCVYLALKMFYPGFFLQDRCFLLLGLFFYVFPSLSTAINPFILFHFSSKFRLAMKNFRIPSVDFSKYGRFLSMPRNRVRSLK